MSRQYVELTEIILEMRKVQERLGKAASEIFELARKRAEAERAYKVALRVEILKLKSEGYPATLINDLARGNEQIAELRFKRDLATERYRAGLESMKTTQTEASLLQSISKYQSEF